MRTRIKLSELKRIIREEVRRGKTLKKLFEQSDDEDDKLEDEMVIEDLADEFFEKALEYKSEMDAQVDEDEYLTSEELIEKSDHWAPDYMSQLEELVDKGYSKEEAQNFIEAAMRKAEDKIRTV